MTSNIGRPSSVNNTPGLNALTTRGERDAAESLPTAEPSAVSTSPAPSMRGRDASRASRLRRQATEQAASNHRIASPAPSSDHVSLSSVEQRLTTDPHGARKDELVALGEITTMDTDEKSPIEEAFRRLNNLRSPPNSHEEHTELLAQLEKAAEVGKIQEQTYIAYANGLKRHSQDPDNLDRPDPNEEYLRHQQVMGEILEGFSLQAENSPSEVYRRNVQMMSEVHEALSLQARNSTGLDPNVNQELRDSLQNAEQLHQRRVAMPPIDEASRQDLENEEMHELASIILLLQTED